MRKVSLTGMEIERKFLTNSEIFDYGKYPYIVLEQGYLSTNPVIRIRKSDDNYYLTYKGEGLMAREEYNLPLTKESYEHLLKKCDGVIIRKRRHLIPFDKYTIELDVFSEPFAPLIMAEVEFESVEEANSFVPPAWFLKEVTKDKRYHNSNMSKGEIPPPYLA